MVSKIGATVYIGRFSPFHLGHAHVLRKALQTSKLVIMLVGSSGNARNVKNPFTFDERVDMINSWKIGETGELGDLRILPLRDYPQNNALWIRNVQRIVKSAVTKYCLQENTILTDIRLTGSDRDDTTWYLHSFPQWKPALVEPLPLNGNVSVSATLVRQWMFSDDKRAQFSEIPENLPKSVLRYLNDFSLTEEFQNLKEEYNFVDKYRAAWDKAPYPPTFVTVDAVVIQSGHVLVVKRGANPGKGLWALPGGFVNQQEKLRDAAIRELIEETGIRLAEGKKAKEITTEILKGSIREKETFDNPDRDLRGRTITTAFLIRLDDTKPLPKVKGLDDAVDAFWVPINDALECTSQWYADHHSILETLVAYKDI